MNTDEIRLHILEYMNSLKYMPMRKRGIAKALEVSDQDYAKFRHLLDEMVESGDIVELRRGKFGLPRTEDGDEAETIAPERHRGSGRSKETSDDEDTESGEEDSTSEQTPEEKFRAPKGATVGRIEVKRGGMGFLLSEPPGNDIFIAEGDLMGALSGDLVAVAVNRRIERNGGRGRRGKFGGGYGGGGHSKPTGRVIKILERGRTRIVGTYHSHRMAHPRRTEPVGYVVPDARGMFSELDVLPDDRGEARNDDKVAVELIETGAAHRAGQRPIGRIVEVFGPAGEPDADTRAIVENFDVRTRFPQEVLDDADALPSEVSESELTDRTDYTQPVTFTIDPADAKDHDDAVAIRREKDGRITLLVHIADVSHYVPEDSRIDVEARERSTSVYLPGSVYPMLPKKISNNLCSLKEGELRLTKTISMTYSPTLTMDAIKIERSYIRSAAFLTYDIVREALDDNKPELVRTPEIFETLKEMKVFAAALRKKRLDTGSLELELPEVRLVLNEQNEVTGWAKAEHHWAHELIEDMMLAANRAVATYLFDHEIPGLFRIHEDPNPEALERFAEFVNDFGISLRPPIDRLKLRSVLERVRHKEYAHTIHLALLTSLKQAKYSAECLPHFALNFTRYLHFTSPIRRYPDLIVHRALDEHFKPGSAALPAQGKKRGGGEAGQAYFKRLAKLRPLAAHCSKRERDAAAAEQEVKKFRQIEFLRRNQKEAHPGIITGVREFGMFVELQDCFVEGMVHVESLHDDYYEYFENQHLLQGRKKHRSFRLGDKVEVRIARIDLGKKQVNLEIV